ncbi:RNA recognition motif domain [Lasallia pustulata]|uniref:RNA recognition motif domain n=1 Tax=Lasallia pustulata TaxID=136370 RepID=A0A1W5CSN8_9LECA|nr:RNA recognition motif domain [Lasallia pustulata]
MHYANQGTIANYPWQGSDIYHPSGPVPLPEALHYPTVSEWYQPGGQEDMQRAAFAVEWFRINQESPADQFGPPPLMVPFSSVSSGQWFTYGFTNGAPMVQVYDGVPMAYPGVQSTQSVPHTAQSIHMNDDGTPINVAQGFVSIESRGVYVHNLSHDATSKDLENLFREVGHVELCEMRKESDKGRQCKAAVTFSSEGEARAAIARFDRRPFMGRILAVRLNKDFTKTQEAPTPSAKAGPSSEGAPSSRVIIADGSKGDLIEWDGGAPSSRVIIADGSRGDLSEWDGGAPSSRVIIADGSRGDLIEWDGGAPSSRVIIADGSRGDLSEWDGGAPSSRVIIADGSRGDLINWDDDPEEVPTV